MHQYTIPLGPTPFTDTVAGRYHLTFDHGATLTIEISLARIASDPDQVVGVLVIDSETRVQAHTTETPAPPDESAG
jgi:hypothetical protein